MAWAMDLGMGNGHWVGCLKYYSIFWDGYSFRFVIDLKRNSSRVDFIKLGMRSRESHRITFNSLFN